MVYSLKQAIEIKKLVIFEVLESLECREIEQLQVDVTTINTMSIIGLICLLKPSYCWPTIVTF